MRPCALGRDSVPLAAARVRGCSRTVPRFNAEQAHIIQLSALYQAGHARAVSVGAAPVQSTAVDTAADVHEATATETSQQRCARLELLVALRQMYRNIMRARALLSLPSPIFKDPSSDSKQARKTAATKSNAAATKSSNAAAATAAATTRAASSAAAAARDADAEELEERTQHAVSICAEMQLTAEQLKAAMRTLPAFGFVFNGDDAAAAAEAEKRVRGMVNHLVHDLRIRNEHEINRLCRGPHAPYATAEAAQAAVSSKNARYLGYKFDESGSLVLAQQSSPMQTLEKAERAAEKFVASRLKPAVRKVREDGLAKALRQSGLYVTGLWGRLNGSGEGMALNLPEQLPLPLSTRKQREATIAAFAKEVDALEKKLVEASKSRENRLRKAGIESRAQMTFVLRGMDEEVLAVSRQLAVRALQLQMEHIHGILEDEVLEFLDDPGSPSFPQRRGSTEEIQLLVAEFALLDQQLAALVDVADTDPKLTVMATIDDKLAKLALEVPDMCSRLGIADQEVFGGPGPSLRKVQLQAKEAAEKVVEGVGFFTRGVRLLGSDVTNASSLFSRAAIGGTLKPREVQALRRTARDILAFVPFTIILVTPLTPVGHVLVFGFIQRYFPNLFPSQFSSRRQELMMRYEDLRKQLLKAQEDAVREEEEAELARAAAAVARLMSPELATAAEANLESQRSNGNGGGNGAHASNNGNILWMAAQPAAAVSQPVADSGNSDDLYSSPIARLAELERQVAAAALHSMTGTDEDDEDDTGPKPDQQSETKRHK